MKTRPTSSTARVFPTAIRIALCAACAVSLTACPSWFGSGRKKGPDELRAGGNALHGMGGRFADAEALDPDHDIGRVPGQLMVPSTPSVPATPHTSAPITPSTSHHH